MWSTYSSSLDAGGDIRAGSVRLRPAYRSTPTGLLLMAPQPPERPTVNREAGDRSQPEELGRRYPEPDPEEMDPDLIYDPAPERATWVDVCR